MGRESTVTFEEVAAAADRIKDAGGKPTSRSVREALGTGGMATILKHFQQWQAGQARQSQATDDTFDPAIGRAISNQIAAKVQQATAETNARLADLQAEANALIVENERQEQEIARLGEELAAAVDQQSALAGRAQQIEDEHARTSAALAAERQAAESARVELAKAELRLEAMPRIENELARVRAELEQERAKSAGLSETAAVAVAKFEASERARTKAEQQLAELERRAEADAAALVFERASVQSCNARLESAAREVTVANESAEKARAAAKKSAEEAAELRGQLAAHQKS